MVSMLKKLYLDTFQFSVKCDGVSNFSQGGPKKNSPEGSGDAGPWRRVGGTDAGGGAVGERRGRGGA